MTHKLSQLSHFVLPTVAAVAATALWITMTGNIASGRPGSGDHETWGLAAALLSARHAEVITDTQRAVSYLAEALAIDPNNTNLLQESYFLAVQIGDFDAAIPTARKAYELLPRTRPGAGHPRGTSLQGQGIRSGLAIYRQDSRPERK